MTPRRLNRLLIAPEIIVVDVAIAALNALDHALLLEHPLADAPPPTEHHPAQRLARHALLHARRLRRALRSYRCFVQHMIRQIELDETLF